MTTEAYRAARRALARHMHRHHAGGWCTGTLAERIEQHDELHFQHAQRGVTTMHAHAILGDDETMEQVAHRYLHEGDHGPADEH